jgi:hypothetical protein
VLQGDIKGTLKTPILTYVQKPGTVYPGPPPPVHASDDSKAGGSSSGKSESEE